MAFWSAALDARCSMRCGRPHLGHPEPGAWRPVLLRLASWTDTLLDRYDAQRAVFAGMADDRYGRPTGESHSTVAMQRRSLQFRRLWINIKAFRKLSP